MINRFVSLWIASLLACCSFSMAQSSMENLNTQQGIDCTDPANASSLACQQGTGQNQQQQPGYPTGQQNINGGYPQTGRGTYNSTSPNGVYTDNGGATRNPNATNLPQVPAPLEPLTEFQRLIASTTNQVIPIYGHDLFRGVPSTFAPVDQIPVTPDYVIGPGDEIRIRVWGQVNFNADVKVDRSGDIYLPQVGRIHVTGIPFSDLSQHIRSEIARVFRNFDLTVDLGQLRSIQVFVVGQAQRPGAYTVSSLSTLVNAVFASGGPSVQGTMRDVQLKRDGKIVTELDLYDLLIRGDKSKDAKLLPGDVIFIPAAGPQVALIGSVRNPAIYELGKTGAGTSVRQLLESAGGLSTIASGSRMSVERIEDRQYRQAMEIALDANGLATPLQDGDVLRVLAIVPSFDKTVTLRGNLANPGRFAWRQGMKLSELIPDRPSLITRNYWWRRAQLGLSGPDFQPLAGRGPLYQPVSPGYLPTPKPPVNCVTTTPTLNASQPATTNQTGTQSASPQVNCTFQTSTANQYQPYAQDMSVNDLSPEAPGLQSYPQSGANTGDWTQSQPINGATGQQHPGLLAAQTEASGSTLAGQQSQVITQNVAAAGAKAEVKLSAPEIDWSYAVIERLDPVTLKTSLLPFNLGKLVIDHDPTQDLPLQAGDVVTIFSQADIRVPLEQQTKFVKLEGEFVGAGVYSVAPGETLRQLVQRSGGFTSNAYLYGSDFTRESTRVFQQQRLDEYVQTLELQIQRSGLVLAANTVSPQDAAAANAAAISQQGLLSRLHQLRATGRIVLEIKPNSSGVDSIPDMQLQDDDRFVVPPMPAGVNVVGSVYDQNTFLYRPNRRVGDYLTLAGGPNREADKRHIFVIRADGAVFSREAANGLWGNNFEATKLNPGDTIVVPEKVIGSSALRSFINWSQVFSQLALGAAAIGALHN
jgi:protein involved in polysaccharide export with SLBB domain